MIGWTQKVRTNHILLLFNRLVSGFWNTHCRLKSFIFVFRMEMKDLVSFALYIMRYGKVRALALSPLQMIEVDHTVRSISNNLLKSNAHPAVSIQQKKIAS